MHSYSLSFSYIEDYKLHVTKAKPSKELRILTNSLHLYWVCIFLTRLGNKRLEIKWRFYSLLTHTCSPSNDYVHHMFSQVL